jgi:excisionase family DNA binding protein
MLSGENFISVSVNSDALESLIESKVEQAVSKAVTSIQNRNPAPADDGWLSRKEARQLLKVSNVTIIDWGKRGIIPVHRIGGTVRYKRSELEASVRQTNLVDRKRGKSD